MLEKQLVKFGRYLISKLDKEDQEKHLKELEDLKQEAKEMAEEKINDIFGE